MSKITQSTTNYKVNRDGTTVVSACECAKLLGIHSSTLYRHFKQSGQTPLKKTSDLTETLTKYGVDISGLKEKGIPDIAFALIVEYYATKASRTTEQAKILHQALTAIGARQFISERAKEEAGDKQIKSQYLETYHDLMGTLKERQCTGKHFGIVNGGINQACGIDKGKRPEMTPRERSMMLMCQGAANVKLIDRPQDIKGQAAYTAVIAAQEAVRSLDYGDYPELLPY